jgi:hypothetical protein
MAKAILFGETRPDGKVLVGSTIHSQPGKQELDIANYPEGYEFDKLPEVPVLGPGKEPVLVFDPSTKGMIWEEKDRPLTQVEAIQAQTAAIERNNALMEQLSAQMGALNTNITETKTAVSDLKPTATKSIS